MKIIEPSVELWSWPCDPLDVIEYAASHSTRTTDKITGEQCVSCENHSKWRHK